MRSRCHAASTGSPAVPMLIHFIQLIGGFLLLVWAADRLLAS